MILRHDDPALMSAKELADELQAEKAAHARTQEWLDRFQGRVSEQAVEIVRLRNALELIATGTWTAPNAIDTMVYIARRAIREDQP